MTNKIKSIQDVEMIVKIYYPKSKISYDAYRKLVLDSDGAYYSDNPDDIGSVTMFSIIELKSFLADDDADSIAAVMALFEPEDGIKIMEAATNLYENAKTSQ